MPNIQNDEAFKRALESLTPADQRVIGAQFVEHVLALNADARVRRAVEVAKNASAAPQELESAGRDANTVAVETYTTCGQDTDWHLQAAHFVATAITSCMTGGGNVAWKAAMHARMARDCEMLASGSATEQPEAESQYQVLEAYLAQR